MNDHFLFNPEAVEAAALCSNGEVDQDDDDPVIPIRQQQLLLDTIRDTSLGSLLKDSDDDNIMEGTSRTDDEVVRDAFSFLNEDIDEEEDKIVWDPRHD
jgi:protein SMG7